MQPPPAAAYPNFRAQSLLFQGLGATFVRNGVLRSKLPLIAKWMKMKKTLLLMLPLSLLLASCQNGELEGNSEKSLEEIKKEGPIKNSDIIRNPVSADEIDTVNVAKISFDEEEYNFGEIRQGEVITHTFTFTNTGKSPLIINSARSTCGCTVPKWPKKPIPPGEEGAIEVRYDSKGKRNRQVKPVTITANTYPNTTRIFLKGFVQVPEEEEEGQD